MEPDPDRRFLHGERPEQRRQRLHLIDIALADPPEDAVIKAAEKAHVVVADKAHAWTEDCYRAAPGLTRARRLVTPPSTSAALKRASRVLHPALAHWGGTRRGA